MSAATDFAMSKYASREARNEAMLQEIEYLRAQLAEVTRARGELKDALHALKLSYDNQAKVAEEHADYFNKQLLATQAHAARMGEVLRGIAKQTPEKPDYWSSCGQCEHNISDAEEALSTPTNLDALHELQEENARLREALAKGRKDAERYQWLKENCALGIKQNGIGWSLNTRQCVAPDCMKELDASIDAARKEQK